MALKFASLIAPLLVAGYAVVAQESTTSPSGLANLFKKAQELSKQMDVGQLAAGAAKAHETLGPLFTQFKSASQPVLGDVQKKLADTGLVPTTTANPVGGVLKNLQFLGVGSDVDVGKVQESAKKAQETFAPLLKQFSGFLNKKTESAAAAAPQEPAKTSIDHFIVEEPKTVSSSAPSAPAPPPSVVSSPSAPQDENALQKLQKYGSKIDPAQVQEGLKKLGSFFNQMKGSNA